MRKALFILPIITICFQSVVAHAQPGVHLAGYWKLDDQVYASTVLDETKKSDGVIHNHVQLAQSGTHINSDAAKFGDGNTYIEIPHHDDYLLDSGSIMLWFNAESISGRKGLLSKDSTNYDTGGHLTIFLESNGKVKVRLQNATGDHNVYSTSTAQINQWHHVAVVFGLGGIELYFDGVLEDTDSYEGGLGATSGGGGNFEPLVLGGNSWVSDDLLATPIIEYFPGLIDEVGILYNRISASTIAQVVSLTGPGGGNVLSDFSALPPVFYVRSNGSDSRDGLTPQKAFGTIQHAVNMCTVPGSTVYVGPGEYRESIEIGIGTGAYAISGTESLPIRVIADTTGAHTDENPGRVLVDGGTASLFGFEFTSRTSWVLEGFTIRNQVDYGIYASNSGISVLDCTIEVPSKFAVYITAIEGVTVADCVFERSASSASSVWVQVTVPDSAVSIVITRNDLTLKGDLYKSVGFASGFAYINDLPAQSRYIYGILVLAWNASVQDVEISNNQVSDYYLGILSLVSSSNGKAIIANNTVTGSLYSIYNYTYQTGNSITINNIVEDSYYGILAPVYQGGSSIVTANLEYKIGALMVPFNRVFEFDIIEGDPRFADAQAGDFSLQRGSPAVDAGTLTNAPSTDIAGNSRPADGDNDEIAVVDLGAYEVVVKSTRVRVVRWREIGTEHNR